MQLYICGRSLESERAITNLGRLCEDVIPGAYDVPIIDVLALPEAAEQARITWTPTLVKTFPRPVRRVVGDLHDLQSVLNALDLPPELVSRRSLSLTPAGELHDPHAGLLMVSPDGMVVLDGEGQVVFANRAAKDLFRWPDSQLRTRRLALPWLDSVHTSLRLPLGGDRFAEARVAPIDWGGRVCQLVCLRDVTPYVRAEAEASSQIADLLATNDRLDRDASCDPLTRVLNRRGLQHALNEVRSRMSRTCAPCSALLIDCDDFKGVNDALGHAAGDQVLKILADTVAGTLRPHDHLGRVGGDEFLVLLPGTQLTAAVQVAERILSALSHCELPDGLSTRRVTVSIGAALLAAGAETVDQVIAVSSAPLGLAKRHGKHRVVIANEANGDHLRAGGGESETERLIRDPASLRVMRQSIVDLASGEPEGWELLVRGPRGRWEQPQALFDAARNLGMLDVLDRHCLEANLSASRCLHGRRHHINVLPRTLLREAREGLSHVMERRPGQAELCLELDEEEILGDPGLLQAVRRELRSRGVLFALDNVGFGRAGLEALILLQPDIIKLRMQMVMHVASSPGRARDLHRLVAAAHGLGIQIIAQGVESEADAAALRDMGVTRGQGFLWGEPVEVGGLQS